MGLENPTFINDLVPANPVGNTDPKSQGDDHIRNIKEVLQNTFKGFAGRFQRVVYKGSNYTALLTDNGSVIATTAALTLTLTAPSTVGNGYSLVVFNDSLGNVTVTPASGEINGSASLVAKAGFALFLWSDGLDYIAVLSQINASAVAGVPTGAVFNFAGAAAPTGWLLCDGTAISRSSFAALFAVIGTTYGDGDGSTTFNLPDYKGRSALGVGQGDTSEDGGTGSNRVLGSKVGAETRTLTENELPPHNHSGSTSSAGVHGHSLLRASGTGTTDVGLAIIEDGSTQFYETALGLNPPWVASAGAHTHSLTTNDAGGGAAHGNMGPALVMNFIIKT